MLDKDFDEVENSILRRIRIIKERYEDVYVRDVDGGIWTDAIDAQYKAAIRPLEDARKALRDAYHCNG